MPSCTDCKMREVDTCSAHNIAINTLDRQLPPPPLGACMIPIVEEYLTQIQPQMKVLDVGCGSWTRIKKYCEQVGAVYEGIDPQKIYIGKETVATRIENLAELSYEDNYFDLVIGNQTMEHWGENGCTILWGLYQCFRVCKPNGKVMINVPIHFHGTKEFMLGDLMSIKSAFQIFTDQIQITEWGKPSNPLPNLYPYPGYWVLKNKPAYVLDIQGIKDKPLPHGITNKNALKGKMAQLVNYPTSYNLYRILKKIGIFKGKHKLVNS